MRRFSITLSIGPQTVRAVKPQVNYTVTVRRRPPHWRSKTRHAIFFSGIMPNAPNRFAGWLCFALLLCFPAYCASQSASIRIRSGLLALYDFGSVEKSLVKDRSGLDKALHLKIPDTNSPVGHGFVDIRAKSLIQAQGSAAKIADAVQLSGEITIEAWLRPARADQS